MITGKNKVSLFVRLCLNFKDSLAKPVAVVVQPLSQVQLFATPWTAAHQALLSSTISQEFAQVNVHCVLQSMGLQRVRHD